MRTLALFVMFVAGVVVGATAVIGIYLFVHRNTTVFTSTRTVIAKGVAIPPGTEFTHQASMSEGFDTLAFCVNVSPDVARTHFQVRTDDRPFLVVPYWVTGETGAR